MFSKSLKTKIVNLAKKQERKIVSKFLNAYQKGKIIKSPENLCNEGTAFQNKALSCVCKIPYGETRSYTDIARAIGKPKAVRAVASAIAKNKLLIVIPCHRVIRSNGDIGKYRLGTKIKNQLLQFEKGNLQNK